MRDTGFASVRPHTSGGLLRDAPVSSIVVCVVEYTRSDAYRGRIRDAIILTGIEFVVIDIIRASDFDNLSTFPSRSLPSTAPSPKH